MVELSAGTIEYTDTGGDGPVLVLVADGRLVEVQDSYTLIPLDQPAQLAEIIGAFA
jgi:hypothetical protein